ncbi:MAG TPA: HD domain-containing protein [Rickettsiales bacterium]|nr:HD domain-containing protein [Rickettsiales bacterium]
MDIKKGQEILKKHYDKQLNIAESSGREKDIFWVKMKYQHSQDVLKIAEYLLENDSLLSKLQNTYKLYGKLGALLHDIGRAYEIGETKLNGIKHGYFGAENILKQEEKEDNPFILWSFKYHDILNAEEETRNELKEINLSNQEKEIVVILLKLVMDSDKLANFKLFFDCEREYLLNLDNKPVFTEKCLTSLKNKNLIKKSDRKTNLDQYLSYITWIYDLNFQTSKDLTLRENYMLNFINKMKEEVVNFSSNLDEEIIKKTLNQIEEISNQLKKDGFL